jgi:chorismate lyase/3-hydroxybenzoate synthase
MTNVNNANTVLRVNSSVEDQHTADLTVSMVPTADLMSHVNQFSSHDSNHVLGVVTYAHSPVISDRAEFPVLNVELQPLQREPLAEVWCSEEMPEHGAAGYIRFNRNATLMFACLELECGTNFQKQTESIYKEILSFVCESGYPNLLRVWNHFPLINEYDKATERYQLFCVGRHSAFQSHYGTDFQLQLPAASAIGTRGSKFSLHFIAATEPGTYLENPRQISAYRYPKQYGLCSPSFARATLFSRGDMSKLILSGTASIVGHETLHNGESEKQLEETLRNIDALLHHESVLAWQQQPAQFSNVKVYVRHPSDLPKVQSRIDEYFGHQASILYLCGDICRGDLLLEIEGICNL